jgi:hypothetical protein
LVIVEIEILAHAFSECPWVFVVMDVDVFVLQTPPKPLDDHVVDRATTAVHGDPYIRLTEAVDKKITRELRSLIGVEYFRVRNLQRTVQDLNTKRGILCV